MRCYCCMFQASDGHNPNVQRTRKLFQTSDGQGPSVRRTRKIPDGQSQSVQQMVPGVRRTKSKDPTDTQSFRRTGSRRPTDTQTARRTRSKRPTDMLRHPELLRLTHGTCLSDSKLVRHTSDACNFVTTFVTIFVLDASALRKSTDSSVQACGEKTN